MSVNYAVHKLIDWIVLIKWAYFLQSERRAQYFDSFVCSVDIKDKIISLVYCSTVSVFITTFILLSFPVRSLLNFAF